MNQLSILVMVSVPYWLLVLMEIALARLTTHAIEDKNLISALSNSYFSKPEKDLIHLLSDPLFIHQSKQIITDLYDISSYQGFYI